MLPPELRGRMLYRLSLYDRFHPESAHDEGVLIFAGYTWYWKIEMSEGVRTLSIYLKEDLLLPMRDTPPRASR